MRSDARKRAVQYSVAHWDPDTAEIIREAQKCAWDEGHRDVCDDCCCRLDVNPYQDRP